MQFTEQSMRFGGRWSKGAKPLEVAPPGEALARCIESGIRDQKPGLWLSKLPAGTSLANDQVLRSPLTIGVPLPAMRPISNGLEHHAGEPLDQVLRPALANYLATGQLPWAARALGPYDFSEGRKLHVAVLRDIVGLRASDGAPEIMELLELGDRNIEGAKEMLKEGRQLLRRLGAWPWASWDSYRAPSHWWREGATFPVARVLAVWRTGNFHTLPSRPKKAKASIAA